MVFIKRLAVFGGTFNPPHIGHLKLAECALNSLDADKIVFMTAGNPPHKNAENYLSGDVRFEMVKLLISDNQNYIASDFEIKKAGPSYTAHTLSELEVMYPGYELCFIIGLDSFYDLEKWYKPEIIFEKAVIAVSLRGGIDSSLFEEKKLYYKKKYNAKFEFISMPEIDVSSSQIRFKIRNGESVKGLTTDTVEKYIMDNNLYK